MLKLYEFFRSSASYRVRIGLNLKGLDYPSCPVNFRKDALSTPETRDFVTLTAPNKAAADKIAAALRAGQTPEQAGAANGGLRPAPFDDTPRSAVADPAVAAAVFGARPALAMARRRSCSDPCSPAAARACPAPARRALFVPNQIRPFSV